MSRRAPFPAKEATTGLTAGGVSPLAQRGSALVITILLSAILGVLGLTFLLVAADEAVISSRMRDQEQLLHVAEAGAWMAKRWFDAPVSGDPAQPGAAHHLFLGRFDTRDPSYFIRNHRLIETDGDPVTPPLAADGTPGREYYRQGREIFPGRPLLDLFQKPFRGAVPVLLMGTEQGPDIILQDRPGPDLLDEINEALFEDQPHTGRIEKIEIFGPPTIRTSTGVARLGIATVKVTAARFRTLDRDGPLWIVPPGAVPAARAVVRMGLAEIPYTLDRGPLQACGSIRSEGKLRAHWGVVAAGRDVTLAGPITRLDETVPSSWPFVAPRRRIDGSQPGGALADWLADPDDSIEDPWLQVIAGGVLTGWEARPDHPFPYDPNRPIDRDHSNLFQRVGGVTCPFSDYKLWKQIASGAMPLNPNAHYFSFDQATGKYRERNRGPARSVREWTDGREGLFFFDTIDGNPPSQNNLAPPVVISGGAWNAAGMIYLNAVSFFVDQARGHARAIIAPGEPFDDENGDHAHDPTETFINLRYPLSLGAGGRSDSFLEDPSAAQASMVVAPGGESYQVQTTTGRDERGLPIVAPVNFMGVFYNAGNIIGEGTATYFGALVAGGDVRQTSVHADSPTIYFDQRLELGLWPPPEIAIPRTYITLWQSSGF